MVKSPLSHLCYVSPCLYIHVRALKCTCIDRDMPSHQRRPSFLFFSRSVWICHCITAAKTCGKLSLNPRFILDFRLQINSSLPCIWAISDFFFGDPSMHAHPPRQARPLAKALEKPHKRGQIFCPGIKEMKAIARMVFFFKKLFEIRCTASNLAFHSVCSALQLSSG